ncbi:hypothetical protein ACIRNI_22835 [Streptomyces sp. NPDC093546]|uniref:hypothetical protein n=1 Tax=Streptomyces sp. NPDC093546 TaxID=3366040 RepID=UPI003803E577
MFERIEKHEQDKGTRPLSTALAMPQQAPPVNRTRTTPANPDDPHGVEASIGLGDIFKVLF